MRVEKVRQSYSPTNTYTIPWDDSTCTIWLTIFYGKWRHEMNLWKISGKLLRSHDLWHGRGGGVMIGHRWSVGCFRWLRIGPTRNNERTTNNQPPATLTKYCTYMFSFTCLFEWCFLLKPCFLSGSPLLPLLLFGCFFFSALRGVHIFALWQPFFCRQ